MTSQEDKPEGVGVMHMDGNSDVEEVTNIVSSNSHDSLITLSYESSSFDEQFEENHSVLPSTCCVFIIKLYIVQTVQYFQLSI